LKALLAGSLSNLMSAALAGLMLGIAPPLAAPPPPTPAAEAAIAPAPAPEAAPADVPATESTKTS
jgi:CNT family concentrative nucleoside transporter